MDFSLTEEQLSKSKEFHIVCKELALKKPLNFQGIDALYETEEGWQYHLYCAQEFAKRGWLSLAWPTEYGGQGDMMDKVLFNEARSYYGIPGVDTFGVRMLAPTILAAGSDEIKREFLAGIAAGKITWCQLWSEPDAGSDLAALSSTAIRNGDEYIINGLKIWITGAHRADWGFGVFKTDPEGRHHHNLSFLLFDMKTPGITINPILFMNGTHIYNEVFFNDVHVPVKIVGQENEGWTVVNTLAAFERSNIGEITRMKRDLDFLVAYCNSTERNGKLLSQDPIVRNRLAQIASEIEAAHCLAYCIADMQSRNEMTLLYAGAVKTFSSEVSERFASVAAEILGRYGQVKHSKWAPLNGWWEQIYQENFVTSISMGTNEIQRNIMAWYGLGLPRMK